MTTTLKMLALNVPLSKWREFEATDRQQTGWHTGKNTDKTAQAIFSSLCHPEAVALVSREFELYPADLRLRLRTLCNERAGSGNVSKGVRRLDALMEGKLLREESFNEHQRVMTSSGWKSRAVNPAVSGATKKYGIIKR